MKYRLHVKIHQNHVRAGEREIKEPNLAAYTNPVQLAIEHAFRQKLGKGHQVILAMGGHVRDDLKLPAWDIRVFCDGPIKMSGQKRYVTRFLSRSACEALYQYNQTGEMKPFGFYMNWMKG